MGRSRWLGHPLTLAAAGSVALAAGAATLSAHGQRIAAAITRSTRVAGRGRSVAAIRVRDTVSAQIDQSGSPTVLAIQDPVSIP